jgi:hypothetical protein
VLVVIVHACLDSCHVNLNLLQNLIHELVGDCLGYLKILAEG